MSLITYAFNRLEINGFKRRLLPLTTYVECIRLTIEPRQYTLSMRHRFYTLNLESRQYTLRSPRRCYDLMLEPRQYTIKATLLLGDMR